MTDDLPILTEAELRSHGIDPQCPVGKREPSYPGRWRCGDDLYTRSSSGCVTKHYGYFTPSQDRVRRFMAEIMANSLRGLLP